MNNIPASDYNLPGILHWLQREYRQIERDRNEWEIEKQELKARIALLEGDAVSKERINVDLTKRIKMYILSLLYRLEFALKKERERLAVSSEPSLSVPLVAESVISMIPSVLTGSANLLNFTKGFGHMRSTELLKRFIRLANTI